MESKIKPHHQRHIRLSKCRDQQKHDLRIEILRNAGSHERPSCTWAGQEEFINNTKLATSLEDLVECAKQLEEARFDRWDPSLIAACPCCDDRTIDPNLGRKEMLARLRDFVWEYVDIAGLLPKTDPRFDLEEQIAALIWDRFQVVDVKASSIGYCSLTASCAHKSLDREFMPWMRCHQCVCEAVYKSKQEINEPTPAGQFNRITRIQFAEGLSQVLGLRMPWLSLRTLLDELAAGKANSVYFETFLQKAVRKPPALEWQKQALLTIAEPMWKLIEYEGMHVKSILDFLLGVSGYVSSARWSALCKHWKIPTTCKPATNAIFQTYGHCGRIELAGLNMLLTDVTLVHLKKLTNRLSKYECQGKDEVNSLQSPCERLLRTRIGATLQFLKMITHSNH